MPWRPWDNMRRTTCRHSLTAVTAHHTSRYDVSHQVATRSTQAQPAVIAMHSNRYFPMATGPTTRCCLHTFTRRAGCKRTTLFEYAAKRPHYSGRYGDDDVTLCADSFILSRLQRVVLRFSMVHCAATSQRHCQAAVIMCSAASQRGVVTAAEGSRASAPDTHTVRMGRSRTC